MERVGITGMGVISAAGLGLEAFSHALRSGQHAFGVLDNYPESLSVRIGAALRNFSLKTWLPEQNAISEDLRKKAKRAAARSPLSVQAATAAALEAWTGAGLAEQSIDPQRLGIVVAGNNLTMQVHYDLAPKLKNDPAYLPGRYALQFLDTDHVGVISEILEIQGEGFTAGGASASGNVGIIKALQMLQLGLADGCMVIGGLTDLSPVEVQGFSNAGAMGGKVFVDQPDQACRPFDKAHEGFIYGQASACLFLETQSSAQRRGKPFLAELAGGAMVLDGHRLSEPNVEGETRVMLTALERAGVAADEVDYINTHGSSSPLGDTTEVQAIRRIYPKNTPMLNATKSITGHCLCAAGVVEAVAVVTQMQEGFLHPTLNLNDPIDPSAQFVGLQAIEKPINIAMSNSFGFGGINSCIILKKN